MAAVEDHQISFSLQVNVEDTLSQARRLQTVLYRGLGLMRRLGLPPEIDAAIAKIQRLIGILNTLRLTMIAVHAASGPIGWALALIGVATFALDFGDFMTSVF